MYNFESQDDLKKVIANNLKNLRLSKNLSLDDLSKLTNVSKSMLGQIERAESSPSITTLWKIATGLNVSFTYLLENTDTSNAVLISKKDLTPLINDSPGFQIFPFFPSGTNRNFEILYIEIEPGASSSSTPHSNNTEEFIIVFEGELKISIKNKSYSLNKEESIMFSANTDHTYKNPGKNTTKLFMVINYLEA